MSGYIQGQSPMQYTFLPFNLDEMIGEDNPVRAINAVVDAMDMDKINFVHSKPSNTGRPAYDPAVMFKIYLYCYLNKVRSSRNIERECKRNIELMWLSGNIAPDHKSIADFRKDNKRPIKEAYREFLHFCDNEGLISHEVVAVDGTKIRANNSRKNNVTISKLNRMIEIQKTSIEKYLEELVQNDIAENQSNINSKIKKAKELISKYEDLKDDMEAMGEKERSLVDPDSHLMGVANKGSEIAYNVQNVVEEQSHLIVASDVVNKKSFSRKFRFLMLMGSMKFQNGYEFLFPETEDRMCMVNIRGSIVLDGLESGNLYGWVNNLVRVSEPHFLESGSIMYDTYYYINQKGERIIPH